MASSVLLLLQLLLLTSLVSVPPHWGVTLNSAYEGENPNEPIKVYISCTVMMCEAGNPNTRCSQGCMNSTRLHVRRKREAMVQSGMHFVSQGPLRLKREADLRGGSAFNLNLNLVFVAGCLLVAVGMVCGVLIYKTKASRVTYQPLSSDVN